MFCPIMLDIQISHGAIARAPGSDRQDEQLTDGTIPATMPSNALAGCHTGPHPLSLEVEKR